MGSWPVSWTVTRDKVVVYVQFVILSILVAYSLGFVRVIVGNDFFVRPIFRTQNDVMDVYQFHHRSFPWFDEIFIHPLSRSILLELASLFLCLGGVYCLTCTMCQSCWYFQLYSPDMPYRWLPPGVDLWKHRSLLSCADLLLRWLKTSVLVLVTSIGEVHVWQLHHGLIPVFREFNFLWPWYCMMRLWQFCTLALVPFHNLGDSTMTVYLLCYL